MRSIVLIVAVGILTLSLGGALPKAAGQGELPKLSVFVEGTTLDGAFAFVADEILLPQVPIILNITFRNNESSAGIVHSFTLDDETATPRIDTGLLDLGQNGTVEFTIVSLDRILFNGSSFAPEQGDRGILFYCIPHRGAGMVGEIVLASRAEAPTEPGVFLRAYWIGMIGIFAMILWIGIAYFVIKSSSGRFTDHKAHVKRGLP